MFKKNLFHPSTWWIIVMAIYAMVDSCKGCKQNKKITPIPASPTDTRLTTPTVPATKLPDKLSDPLHGSTDSLYSEASAVSSASSSSWVSSGASATSSGYASSRSSNSSGSSAAPKPFDPLFSFAGLANLGNSCFMNAALQVIAALYPEEAQDGPLKGLVNKINAGPGVISRDVIEGFVADFPEKAREMVNSGFQHDVDEFIRCFDEAKFLDSITFTSRILYKKQTEAGICVNKMAEKVDDTLRISFKKDENWDKYDLNELVALNMEEFIDATDVGECRNVDPTNCVTFSMEKISAFVAKHQSKLAPMQEDAGKLKNYIEQIVYKRMPAKLYLQLNRFVNSNDKINDPVHGTMEFTICPDPNYKDGVLKYNLHAFIQYSGGGTNGGHYIAYVKRGAEWYMVSDRTIEKSSLSNVIDASKTAYLLFYKK